MSTRSTLSLILVTAVVMVGCSQQSLPGEDDPQVMAVFRGGQVSAADIDQRVLVLPLERRPQPGGDLQAWYKDLTRLLAVEKLLLAEAESTQAAEQPDYRAARDAARYRIGSQLCLQQMQPKTEPISEEQLHQAYEEQKDTLIRDEQRLVRNLFRRRQPEMTDAALRGELEQLRDRVLNGESFGLLAGETSDSETRHNQGQIGWIGRGRLQADLDPIIFALDEGLPSKPIITAEGGHLFFVEQIQARKRYTFEEVRGQLFNQLTAQRRLAALQQLEQELALPEDSLVPNADELGELLKADDPAAVVLQIGDYSLTAREFRVMVTQARSRSAGAAAPPWGIFERARARALVYYHCTAQNLLVAGIIDERMSEWEEQTLLSRFRNQKLRQRAAGDVQRLREYYEHHSNQFSSPPKWKLRRLVVPLQIGADATLARLELAVSELDSGALKLEALAEELGGHIDTFDWMTLTELRREEPRMARFVARLSAGRHSAPFRTESTLQLLQVVDRQEPQVYAFADAEEQVLASYLAQNRHDLYLQLSEELLEQARFKIIPGRLEALHEPAMPDPEINLDELEELLEETAE